MGSNIKNIEGMTIQQLTEEIKAGGKFVRYQFCISIVVMTFRRSTPIYFVRSGESAVKFGIGASILSFFFGWWGIPWGPIYTIQSLIRNFGGGMDITSEVLASIVAAAKKE